MAKRDRKQLTARIEKFLRQYARKAWTNSGVGDPNDRHYDREVEKIVKRMSAEELDRLLREGEDEDSA